MSASTNIERASELRTIVDACALVDTLGEQATGELVVEAAAGSAGTVFVERGRVCWAAARGLSRRLSQLLVERASVPPGAMETHFAWCKSQRVPLGEHLVNAGLLGARDLREALLVHTVESLLRLCGSDTRASFRPRSGEGYNPRFTFATAELVTRGFATAHTARAAQLQQTLDDLFADEPWAAAFVRTPTVAFPEPVALSGVDAIPASALLRYGKWGASALDLLSTFTEPSALLSVMRPRETALVAFRHGDALVVGETGVHGPARILNRRAQARAREKREKGERADASL